MTVTQIGFATQPPLTDADIGKQIARVVPKNGEDYSYMLSAPKSPSDSLSDCDNPKLKRLQGTKMEVKIFGLPPKMVENDGSWITIEKAQEIFRQNRGFSLYTYQLGPERGYPFEAYPFEAW